MFQQQVGLNSILKEGGRHFSGVDEALLRNIEACKNLAKITSTSLGPHGTNKLIVNHIGKHFVTSDTSTMVEELEVMHPAAKMLVLSAKSQEQECGDCTNFTVTFGGELLAKAEELLKEGIHAADIIKGYTLARDKAVEVFNSNRCWHVTDMYSKEQLQQCVQTAISAKQLGQEANLAKLVAEASCICMPKVPSNFDVDNIRVTKVVGGLLSRSFVVEGMALARSCVGVCQSKKKCKVAVYANGIEMSATETKGTVLLNNAEELMNFTKSEEAKMEEFIKSIKDAGVEFVVAGSTITEIAVHYLNKYDLMTLKVPSKFELKRVCRTLGATAIIRTGPPLPEEMGYAESVEVEEIASQKVTVIKTGDSKVATIVLRGATPNVLDEMERSIDDAANVVRCTTRDPHFVPGAGATEIELAHELQQFGATVPGLEQYAVLKFAEALEVVPKVLAQNAGHNHTEAITALYAAHQKGEKAVGVDVESGELLCNAKDKLILDHGESKKWALRFACDAILTVLQVDQIIMAKQAGGPKGGGGGGRDDD